jgi:hypothetical protein
MDTPEAPEELTVRSNGPDEVVKELEGEYPLSNWLSA